MGCLDHQSYVGRVWIYNEFPPSDEQFWVMLLNKCVTRLFLKRKVTIYEPQILEPIPSMYGISLLYLPTFGGCFCEMPATIPYMNSMGKEFLEFPLRPNPLTLASWNIFRSQTQINLVTFGHLQLPRQ